MSFIGESNFSSDPISSPMAPSALKEEGPGLSCSCLPWALPNRCRRECRARLISAPFLAPETRVGPLDETEELVRCPGSVSSCQALSPWAREKGSCCLASSSLSVKAQLALQLVAIKRARLHPVCLLFFWATPLRWALWSPGTLTAGLKARTPGLMLRSSLCSAIQGGWSLCL